MRGILLRLGIVSAFAAAVAMAQPAAYTSVAKWRFRFDYKASKTAKSSDAEWSWQVTAKADFVLDTRRGRTEWYGHSNAQIDAKLTGSVKVGCPSTQTIEYKGPARRMEQPDAGLSLFREGYQIDMGNPWVTATDTYEFNCPGLGKAVETTQFNWNTIYTEMIPYPASGMTLSGTLKSSEYRAGLLAMVYVMELIDTEITYTITPEGEDDLRLEIDNTEQYQRWRPTATLSGDAGERLSLRAAVVSTTGQTPNVQVDQFIWQLADTSQEPGVAMNYPAESQDVRFDMELEAEGEGVVVSETRQRVERNIRGRGLSDTITVAPYDWGGWSELRVTAVLSDGRRLTGRLKGASQDHVKLPKRTGTSLIADVWKQEKGVSGPDSADNETSPMGDGNPGDGLTLYEEYRGFYENGEHIEGNPKKKDYFAVNEAGSTGAGGLALFQRRSGLAVHGKLWLDEVSQDLVINHNYSAAPHRVDQHAVLIRVDPNLKGAAEAVSRVDRPSTPKDFKHVGLPARMPSRPTASASASYASVTVAHELFHTVNVYHHGESDEAVHWSRGGDGRLYERAANGDETGPDPDSPPRAIRVFTEQGEEVTDRVRLGIRRLGRENGQHSGWENCVIRYDISDSYVSRANPNDRFVGFREVPGAGLCDTTEGASVNSPARTPQSRYGPAAPARGNCLGQILVNDAVTPPKRVLP